MNHKSSNYSCIWENLFKIVTIMPKSACDFNGVSSYDGPDMNLWISWTSLNLYPHDYGQFNFYLVFLFVLFIYYLISLFIF